MTIESPEDRLAMLKDFGVEATIDNYIVTGIFDSDAYLIEDGRESFTTDTLTFLMRTSEIGDIKVGTDITVDGQTYTVRDIQSDSTGMTELMLYIKD